jgi:hypothetical protein
VGTLTLAPSLLPSNQVEVEGVFTSEEGLTSLEPHEEQEAQSSPCL